MESIKSKIKTQIKKAGRGKFVFPSNFASFASQDSSIKALQRLMAAGDIIRITHGVYYYPRIDKKYGLGIIYPTISEIAIAIAQRDKVSIFPTGSYALHALGLSDQVPGNAVFVTNGSDRKVDVGCGRKIEFKHSDNARNFSYKSPQIQLVVAALREIGEGKATENELMRLKDVISEVPTAICNHDMTLAPIWVRKTFMTI